MELKELLRVSPPLPAEDLCGYILRLNEKNHYDFPNWIYNLAGIKKHAPINGNLLDPRDTDLSRLSWLTGIEENVLWSMAFPPATVCGRKGEFNAAFGTVIPRFAVHTHKARVCPECLKEDLYCRKVWDIVAVTACPVHRCLLVDECPSCGKPITWSRSSVAVCRCGFDWRELNLSKLEDDDLNLSRHIHHLCGVSDYGGIFKGLGNINPLKTFDLEQLITHLFFIAGQLLQRSGHWRAFNSLSLRNIRVHELFTKAYPVFYKWPIEFYRMLDQYRDEKGHSKRDTGVERDFGRFYNALYKSLPDSPNSPLREVFERYLAVHWDGGYLNKKLRVSEEMLSKKKYITAADAGRILNTNATHVQRLVETGTVMGTVRNMGSRTMTLALAESVESFRASLEKAIPLAGAAQALGVGHESIVDIVKNHCIEALRGPNLDGYAHWIFSPEAIAELFEKIDSKIIIKSASSKLETVSFSKALRIASGFGFSIGEFVHFVLMGDLKPCYKIAGTGMNMYVFLKNDIHNLFKKINKETNGALTVLDVSKLLGVKQEVAAWWMEKGFIACKVLFGKKTRRKISMENLKIFKSHFITLAEIAKDYGKSPKILVTELMGNGVQPVSGPKVDGGRQYLFRKADIKNAIKKQLFHCTAENMSQA